MFGFSRQSNKEVKSTSATDHAAATKRDRRKISGERVACHCEFTLADPDPFKHCKVHIRGLIILNVRGCGIYPEQALSFDDTKRTFPESRLLTIKELKIKGPDDQPYSLPNLSIRRVRLVNDENGDGIILRFVNLTEQQLDTLVSISQRYSVNS